MKICQNRKHVLILQFSALKIMQIAFMQQNELCGYCYRDTLLDSTKTMACMYKVERCQRKHDRLLHRDWKPSYAYEDQFPASINPSAIGVDLSNSTESTSNQMLFNVVPVSFCSRKTNVEAFVFFNQNSMTTLCDACLFESLGICGENTSYSITTVNQTYEQRNGKEVKSLILTLESSKTIHLKNAY